MVPAKVIASTAAALALAACSSSPEFTWESIPVNGHITGVTAVAGDNVSEALGVVDSVYTAPSGRVFTCGSTPAVARTLIAVQPRLAYLKEVIGYAPEAMPKFKPESPLSNWVADAALKGCEALCGKHVDMAVVNFGGIRVDMPVGKVLLDDIVSMFPFRNNYAVVELRGKDVRKLLEHLAGAVQPVSGVRMVIKDRKLVSAELGGKPIDDNRTYRVGTLDFLLDGGDGLYVARNAKSLVVGDEKVSEWMTAYVRNLTASGEAVRGKADGRVVIEK